jgi:predicted nucleic acid-binding protein
MVNVYVESNYVLELAFQQEQSDECEQILRFAELGSISLILPAYCFAESHEKLSRQRDKRIALQRDLDVEIRQLRRTATYGLRIDSLRDISSLLIQSYKEERLRFERFRDRLLQTCQLIPLTQQILVAAAANERRFDLKPQDAIVFAAVMQHLVSQAGEASCFLNKNTRDFDNPDIIEEVRRHHCRMIPRFDDGLRYIRGHSSGE